MVKYVKGDLFDSDADIFAHGCNCRGGFGSGIAGSMSRIYPKTRHEYLEKFEDEGWKLGDVQFVRVFSPGSRDRVVANCATQDEYYPRDKCHANYPAIKTCM